MCEEVHFYLSCRLALQAYSRQLYLQMNSFTGIFQGFYRDFKNTVLSHPMLPTCIDCCHKAICQQFLKKGDIFEHTLKPIMA